LQWWFVVPRVGDEFGGAWYDRRTGEITMVQVPATPIVDTGTGDGAVAMANLSRRHRCHRRSHTQRRHSHHSDVDAPAIRVSPASR
jgi:hypothetical protein